MATFIAGPGVSSDTFLTLDRVPDGRTCRVTHVDLRDTGLHLLEMGVTPGTLIRVVRSAPFGNPIDIVIRGYHLSLRRREAESVSVVMEPDEGPRR
jgi:Fe2+ transport system protein FeoA